MGEVRHLGAQGAEEQDVLGRVGEVILTADDMRDGHGGVVDADREVVERRAIGADDDQVAAQGLGRDLDATADDVVEGDGPLPDPEADDGLASLGLARAPIGSREAGAAAHVVRRLVGGLLCAAIGGQLVWRAVAAVGAIVAQQTLGGRLVDRQSLHLAIRPVWPAGGQTGHLRTLVPLEPQPVQPVEDVALVLDRRAGEVRVLEAEHEGATHVAREEVVEEGGPGGPDVERPGRAGRDAAADGHAAIVADARRLRCSLSRC